METKRKIMIATQAISILNDQIGLNFINGHDAMNSGLDQVKKFIEANFAALKSLVTSF